MDLIPADRLNVSDTNAVPTIDQQEPVVRGLSAGAIDVGVVALGTFTVALILAERFRLVDRVDGRAVFSEADQTRINQIDEGFNRAVRIGDSVFTLSGSGWWLTMLSLVALTALMFFILPSRLHRRTPGRLLVGLPKPVRTAPPGEPLEILAEAETAPTEEQAERQEQDGLEEQEDRSVQEATVGEGPGGDDPGVARKPVPSLTVLSQLVPSQTVLSDTVPSNTVPSNTVPSEMVPSQTVPSIERTPEIEQATAEVTAVGEPEMVALSAPATRRTLGDADEYLSWDRRQAVCKTRVTAPEPATNARFDALALPESSLAETSIHASVTTSKTSGSGDARPSSGPAAGQTPIWSDEWNAWVYRDPTSRRWFRHDTTVDQWQPIG